jgi:hypothetical protein
MTAFGIDRPIVPSTVVEESELRERKVAYGSISARCYNYNLLVLLVKDESVNRNVYSSLQGIKTVQSRILLDSN